MDNVFKTLAHVQKQRDIDTVSNAAMLLANHNSGHLLTILKGIFHLFFGNRLILQLLRVKQLGLQFSNPFSWFSDIWKNITISVTRQCLVPLTSIVYIFSYYGSQWDQKLVTDITRQNISENQLNGFENGKTQLFNSEGVVKWAYFPKKGSIPLKERPLKTFNFL